MTTEVRARQAVDADVEEAADAQAQQGERDRCAMVSGVIVGGRRDRRASGDSSDRVRHADRRRSPGSISKGVPAGSSGMPRQDAACGSATATNMARPAAADCAARRAAAGRSSRARRAAAGRAPPSAAATAPRTARICCQQEARRGAIAALDQHRRGDRLEPVRRARLRRGAPEPRRGRLPCPAGASNGRRRCRGNTATSSAAPRCPSAGARSPDRAGPAPPGYASLRKIAPNR